ncbi:hypothetical protein QQM79_03365 [Marinobacteraceae bacterium S3BR75-40.1]
MSHQLEVFQGLGPVVERLERQAIHPEPRNRLYPNLVLLAMSNDGVTNSEILLQLKRFPLLSAVPVVLFYSPANETDAARAYGNGASSVIRLPLRFADLVEMMRVMEEYWFGAVRPPTF